MYKDVHFSATSFLSNTRRTLPRMGILPTFTPLKKPKFLLGGENTPFRAVFFLPLKPPTCSYCSDTRSEKLYVTDVLSIAQNSRCELHTEVQFTYRHGRRKSRRSCEFAKQTRVEKLYRDVQFFKPVAASIAVCDTYIPPDVRVMA